MLQKQKGELAELIFHELFHGTIYVSGQVDLNENLAEFIAEKATLVFFNSDKTIPLLFHASLWLGSKISALSKQFKASW